MALKLSNFAHEGVEFPDPKQYPPPGAIIFSKYMTLFLISSTLPLASKSTSTLPKMAIFLPYFSLISLISSAVGSIG